VPNGWARIPTYPVEVQIVASIEKKKRGAELRFLGS
jgi:hypothetical protein